MPDILIDFVKYFRQIKVKSCPIRTHVLQNISSRLLIYFVKLEIIFAYKIRPCCDFVNSSFWELLTLRFVKSTLSPHRFDLRTADDEAFAPHHGYICTAASLYYFIITYLGIIIKILIKIIRLFLLII
jgi:hypothetical protein